MPNASDTCVLQGNERQARLDKQIIAGVPGYSAPLTIIQAENKGESSGGKFLNVSAETFVYFYVLARKCERRLVKTPVGAIAPNPDA